MKRIIIAMFVGSLAAGCSSPSSSSSSSERASQPAAKPAAPPKDVCMCKGGSCLCSHCGTGKGACVCKK